MTYPGEVKLVLYLLNCRNKSFLHATKFDYATLAAGNIRFMVDRGSYCIILLTDHFEGLSFPIVEHILEVIPSSGVVMVSKDTANATTNLNETNLRQVLHVNLDTQEEVRHLFIFILHSLQNTARPVLHLHKRKHTLTITETQDIGPLSGRLINQRN